MGYFYPSKIHAYYQWHLDTARMWARYALQNKKEGTNWHGCAELAHSHLKHALSIIS